MLRDDVLLMLLREGVGQAIEEWDWDDVVPLNDDAIDEEEMETQSRSDEIDAAWEMEDEIHDELAALHREAMLEEIAELEADLDDGESLWQSPYDLAIYNAEFLTYGAPSHLLSRYRRLMRDDVQREGFRRAVCNRLFFKNWNNRKFQKRESGFRGSVGLSRSWKRHRHHQAREQTFPRHRKEDLVAA